VKTLLLSKLMVASIFLAVNLYAGESVQTGVFYGYGDLKWGSSLEAAKVKYVDLVAVDASDKGSTQYEQLNPTKLIKTRALSFYNNKLYKVYVEFNTDLDIQTYKAIMSKITTPLGKAHQIDDKKDMVGNFYVSGVTQVWWFYDDKMYVDLKLWMYTTATGYNAGESFSVLYINKVIQGEMEQAQLDRASAELEDIY